MLLGSLRIGLNVLNILPLPVSPYNGLSIRKLFGDLRQMNLKQYCTLSGVLQRRVRGGYSSSPIATCEGITEPLKSEIERLERLLCGLSWEPPMSAPQLK